VFRPNDRDASFATSDFSNWWKLEQKYGDFQLKRDIREIINLLQETRTPLLKAKELNGWKEMEIEAGMQK
jgi:hypothetical protein